jgi:hypothetical protein
VLSAAVEQIVYSLQLAKFKHLGEAMFLRGAFVQYIAARRTQTNWQRKLARGAYLKYLAERTIQKVWRGLRYTQCLCCDLHRIIPASSTQRAPYVAYKAQRVIRRKSFSAILSIQTSWRRKLRREAFQQVIVETVKHDRVDGPSCNKVNVRSIQTYWKGKSTTAVCIQKHWRGRTISVRSRRINISAIEQFILFAALRLYGRGRSLRQAYRQHFSGTLYPGDLERQNRPFIHPWIMAHGHGVTDSAKDILDRILLPSKLDGMKDPDLCRTNPVALNYYLNSLHQRKQL